jgi:hypothetical protein
MGKLSEKLKGNLWNELKLKHQQKLIWPLKF